LVLDLDPLGYMRASELVTRGRGRNYLENREMLFATEAQLRQAYDDIAHVVAEKLLAPVGPPTAARASSSDARLAAGPAA